MNQNNQQPGSADLLPCPFCGSTNVEHDAWSSLTADGPGCDDCGATAASNADWNKRAQPSTELPIFCYAKQVHSGWPEFNKADEFSDGEGGGEALVKLSDAIAASRRAAGGEEVAEELKWYKEAHTAVSGKLASVWDGIREAVQKYSGTPCEGEPFDRLHELLARLAAPASPPDVPSPASQDAAAPAGLTDRSVKLSKAQQLVIDQMKDGWMLHGNGTIKPGNREEQVGNMRLVSRRVIMALKDMGLIEFTFGSDYWSLVPRIDGDKQGAQGGGNG